MPYDPVPQAPPQQSQPEPQPESQPVKQTGRRHVPIIAGGIVVVLVLLAIVSVVVARNKPAAEGSFASLTELRDAAVAAGYPCPSWEQHDQTVGASESGMCSGADVILLYDDQDAKLRSAEGYEAMAEVSGHANALVGPNWIIHRSDGQYLATLQQKLGGELVPGDAPTASPTTQLPWNVLYEVYGDGEWADVTMATPTGTKQHSPDLPMQLAEPDFWDPTEGVPYLFRSGDFVYISAQNKEDQYGTIGCRISRSDGTIISENTSSGEFAVVTCDGVA